MVSRVSSVRCHLSVEHATLIGWDHVLNVDECVLTAVDFKHLESGLDKFTQVLSLPLAVVDLVAEVGVLGLHQVHHWENLTVVWDQSFTDGVGASDKGLQDLQSDGDDLWIAGVQGGLDWDDQLRDDWEHLGATFLEHVERSLYGEEPVWVLLLTDTLEEDWKVVVVVQGHNVDLPEELVGGTVVNSNREISSVIETSEFRGWNWAASDGSSLWLCNWCLFLWLGQ